MLQTPNPLGSVRPASSEAAASHQRARPEGGLRHARPFGERVVRCEAWRDHGDPWGFGQR